MSTVHDIALASNHLVISGVNWPCFLRQEPFLGVCDPGYVKLFLSLNARPQPQHLGTGSNWKEPSSWVGFVASRGSREVGSELGQVLGLVLGPHL